MIYHAIWFFLGAICGGTAVALLVLYTTVALGMPGSRRKWGRPQ
jgi:hypothetical protein